MCASETDKRGLCSIGLPMQRLEVKIVNEQGEIVDIDKNGELWCRDYSVLSAYWNDDEKTRETITSAFKWLKTNDVVRMDEDRYLYFCGRKKEMNIRGGTKISF
ncbi:unnamed protein product [Didymodactylos carnosus]|uniref:Uncharacterized protein n=1 Tax=Didymodactylos carnosus TaxID=1234261 RepID=A0A813S4Y4_9BILA|nr:unnamed protein product [Didymodactylos carnosus]CAF0790028.1 unnamed protein product [Didymodactylos carnosus]CAF3538036.1 unnamed protein product [Didymodactylos carnosus]CAF3574229.1 unnamed protein product [Didymodactylos carnosus]